MLHTLFKKRIPVNSLYSSRYDSKKLISFLTDKDHPDVLTSSSTVVAASLPNQNISMPSTIVSNINNFEKYQPIKLGIQLSKYSVNLTKLASQGELEKVIGRYDEIQQVIQILTRRRKNNPCIIGTK